MNPTTMNEEARGAWASRPSSLRYPAWREIAWRVWTNSGTHNLGLMAAGIAFYAFLSFVPLLGSLVMTYGLVADPSTVAEHMDVAVRHLPRSASSLVNDQLLSLTSTAAEKKGLGLLLALAVAIFGATRASGALISALNVVYEQNDRRGFLRGFGLATVLILCIMAVGLLGLVAASLYAFMGDLAAELGWAWATMLRLLAVAGRRFGVHPEPGRHLPLRTRPRGSQVALADHRVGGCDVRLAARNVGLRTLCGELRQI